jgi:type IV secretory pathway TrbL component
MRWHADAHKLSQVNKQLQHKDNKLKILEVIMHIYLFMWFSLLTISALCLSVQLHKATKGLNS